MSPMLALALTSAVVVLAVVVGVVFRRLDGRRRGGGHLFFDTAHASSSLGRRATLVQFSTETCARCPHVRRMLAEYATESDEVRFLEIDLTHRPDLSAQYKVLQTPTTFVVDRSGAVRARFQGVPHRHALNEALAAV